VPEEDAASDQISVRVPEGALPGMQMKAQTPGGRSFTITIPAGATPGMKLLVSKRAEIPKEFSAWRPGDLGPMVSVEV